MDWREITDGVAVLTNYTEQMREHGLAAAKADAEYRKRKAIAILDEKSKGTPATICKDVIYARPDMIDALMERNCAQAIYDADKEAINTMKIRLRIYDAQLARDWQAAGERGY